MPSVTYRGENYTVDTGGFLANPGNWNEDFAEGAAEALGFEGGLTEEQWKVIRFIRRSYELTGRCPMIYETCKACRLKLSGLRTLFPQGYQRGACRLAGVTYRESVNLAWTDMVAEKPAAAPADRTYRTDVRGFLVDAGEWDENWARHRAMDLRFRAGLSEKHWAILHYLRERHAETGRIPTVFETCEAHGLELDALESLFPDGYHRGAVRLAGLRLP